MPIKKACYAVYLIIFLITGNAIAQQLNTDNIIAKHLDSIGTEENRKALKNMMLMGMSEFESRLPQRKSLGKVAIVSNSANLLFISSFMAQSYPFEKIGFFDGKINIPFTTPGVRSPLGDFLQEHPDILQNGLFSGSMSLNWRLLDAKSKKGTFSYAGTKKIDGRKAHIIEYFFKGNSPSLKTKLFFDAETFQHIRSEYKDEFEGRQSTFGKLGQDTSFIIELTETFSDFKTYENITLPSASKIHYATSSRSGSWEYDWVFKVSDVKFNQTLKEDFFNFN